MKLPHKRGTAELAPNWHPDFRNVSALPDLKVVRTSFFVNALCVTIAAVVLLVTVYREYMAFSLRSEINAAEEAMQTKAGRNNELLALNREFTEAMRRVQEAATFSEAPFAASELLVALSRSLPTNMDFTTIAYDNNVLTLRGTIRGASESASTHVSAYLDVLRQDPLIGKLFPDVSLISLLRNPNTLGLTFEILLKPATAGAPAKRKG